MTDEKTFTTNTAIRYTPEFKQTLIDLHEKGHSLKKLHEEYGLSLDTIRKWVQVATVIAIDHQWYCLGSRLCHVMP
ncbi:transposase [Lacticaseibacillus paracasei]|uniref:Transposase n=1 Tax=Lacticaseibacillus paracasei NRIC 0644 TaxID=1435038 RepID=A0A0C9QC00_LACPA|nr:transposase [Lacticaseibacillus paracasei]GAN37292.1 transposase [Lacticaseibacillus paracasei NRIC 0644]